MAHKNVHTKPCLSSQCQILAVHTCTLSQAKTSGPKTFRHTSKTVYTAPQTRITPHPPPPPPPKVSASVVVGCSNLYRNPATAAQSVKGTIHSHAYNPPLQAGLLLIDLYTHLTTRSALALSLSLSLDLITCLCLMVQACVNHFL